MDEFLKEFLRLEGFLIPRKNPNWIHEGILNEIHGRITWNITNQTSEEIFGVICKKNIVKQAVIRVLISRGIKKKSWKYSQKNACSNEGSNSHVVIPFVFGLFFFQEGQSSFNFYANIQNASREIFWDVHKSEFHFNGKAILFSKVRIDCLLLTLIIESTYRSFVKVFG